MNALQLLVDLGRLLHVRHVAGAVEHRDRHAGRQPLGVAHRQDLVLAAPDHLHRHGQLAQPAGQLQRLPAAGEAFPGDAVERRLDAIQALVLQHLLDHLARDGGRIGDQHLEHRLQLLAPPRLHEAVDVGHVDLGPERRRADQGRRRDPIGVVERQVERDGAAERVADQMRLGDLLGVHEVEHRRRERADVGLAAAQILGRAAVAGQVERIGDVVFRERLLIELPAVQVAAEAMDEDHRRPLARPHLEIAQAAAAGLDRRRLRPRLAGLGGVRRELLLERRDEAVEIAVRHAVVGHHGEQGADRHGLALADHLPPQRPRYRALEDVGDLRGLDVEDLLAGGDLGAHLHQPARDHSFLHRQAPLGHDDRPYRVAHRAASFRDLQLAQFAMVRRTAASILSGPGM